MNTITPHTPPRPAGNSRRPAPVRLTGRDLELLSFIAAHRFVHATHAQHFLQARCSVTYRRLARLTNAGLLRHERIFHAQPGVFMITNGGLGMIDSPLQKPTIDLRLYRHESSAPVLWLAARAGVFGEAAEVWTERQIIHHDQVPQHQDHAQLAVSLGGLDRAGRLRRHSPDLLIAHEDGGRTAVELELSVKGRRRLDEILLAYQLDDTINRVFYVTDQRTVVDAVGAAAGLLAPDKVVIVRAGLPLSLSLLGVSVTVAGVAGRLS
jgi:hypothetical protein